MQSPVQNRVVFIPPTTELEFYTALATYLQVRWQF